MQEILAKLETSQKEFWNISRVTGRFLNILVREANAENVLEIGTSNGYSGIWLGSAVRRTGGKLITIEYWEKRLSIAKENFIKCGLADYIEAIQGDAIEVLNALPADYTADFVFIDANKSQYLQYFEIIDKHLKPGGIIACDNVLSHKEKCRPFIETVNARPDYYNVILDLPAGLSLAKKLAVKCD
ncbi:MAG: O-methyltransferase [Heliobacteriaceae bacterium]|jgi:predicted O-methyltransferase YrrM|nr:O-methyltransferase [Heliobacteriaceae bacterium]